MDINSFFNGTKSVLICIYQYWNRKKDYESELKKISDLYDFLSKKNYKVKFLQKINKKNFKIARYAMVEEYHKKIKENLERTLYDLKSEIKSLDGKIFVDSSPVFEKKLAIMAGLGIQGKNTLLISPKYGSYIFIGGIALNIDAEYIIPMMGELKCTECDMCERMCPKKAIKNYKLSPSECISFWTTHNNGNDIPPEIINSSSYVFGCDVCQEHCPYNATALTSERTIFL
jgi:epoxyqueuosine reductase